MDHNFGSKIKEQVVQPGIKVINKDCTIEHQYCNGGDVDNTNTHIKYRHIDLYRDCHIVDNHCIVEHIVPIRVKEEEIKVEVTDSQLLDQF